ncbi:MAG: hypothetical protein WC389_10950 [Lutibacter sp.]|jgi:hypothetical protein
MIILEAENHATKDIGYCQVEDDAEMKNILLAKGFLELIPFELYSGHNENQQEISVMKAIFPHINMLLPVRGEK